MNNRVDTRNLFRELTRPTTSNHSEDTKLVLKRGQELQQIRRINEYIKEEGTLPPQRPNYYAKLNVI